MWLCNSMNSVGNTQCLTTCKICVPHETMLFPRIFPWPWKCRLEVLFIGSLGKRLRVLELVKLVRLAQRITSQNPQAWDFDITRCRQMEGMYACMQSILTFDNHQGWTVAHGHVCPITITSYSRLCVTTQTFYNELDYLS